MSAPVQAPRRQRRNPLGWPIRAGLAFTALLFALATHAALVTMPPAAAEMETFLPAVHRVAAGVQPLWKAPSPALTAYLAGVWRLTGPSLPAARCAMLLAAGLALYFAFLLGVELCGSTPGMPALFAVFLLALSPIFYIQSVLIHPETLAAVALLAALYWFLCEHHPWGAAASAVAALTLPAGAWVGLALGGVLASERRWRRAAPYLLVSLAAALLWWNHPNPAPQSAGLFASVFHVGRLLYHLLIGHGHWIAVLAIVAAWRAGVLNRRRWRTTSLLAAGWVLIQVWPGRALPERALLPILPILFVAATASLFAMPARRRWLGYSALAALLLAGHFVNPFLWPFPYENNLMVVSDARLRTRVAQWLEQNYPRAGVATSGPLALALTDSRWGFVQRPLTVLRLQAFDEEDLTLAMQANPDIFVFYSLDWDPPANLLRRREFAWVASRILGIRSPLDPQAIEDGLGLRRTAFLREGQQWAEIYTRPSLIVEP